MFRPSSFIVFLLLLLSLLFSLLLLLFLFFLSFFCFFFLVYVFFLYFFFFFLVFRFVLTFLFLFSFSVLSFLFYFLFSVIIIYFTFFFWKNYPDKIRVWYIPCQKYWMHDFTLWLRSRCELENLYVAKKMWLMQSWCDCEMSKYLDIVVANRNLKRWLNVERLFIFKDTNLFKLVMSGGAMVNTKWWHCLWGKFWGSIERQRIPS